MDTGNLNLLYAVVKRLSQKRLPFVLKGNLLTRFILETNGVTDTNRITRDIDMISESTVSLEKVRREVEIVLSELGVTDCTVQIKRNSKENQTGKIQVYRDGRSLISLDVGFSQTEFIEDYITTDGVVFRGVSPVKVISDKVSVLSKDILLRRVKDMYDVFMLSRAGEVFLREILYVLQTDGRTIGDFNTFFNKIPELEHAYSRLRGIENKPDFKVVYSRCSSFIMPFATKPSLDLRWSVKDAMWYEISKW